MITDPDSNRDKDPDTGFEHDKYPDPHFWF